MLLVGMARPVVIVKLDFFNLSLLELTKPFNALRNRLFVYPLAQSVRMISRLFQSRPRSTSIVLRKSQLVMARFHHVSPGREPRHCSLESYSPVSQSGVKRDIVPPKPCVASLQCEHTHQAGAECEVTHRRPASAEKIEMPPQILMVEIPGGRAAPFDSRYA